MLMWSFGPLEIEGQCQVGARQVGTLAIVT